MNTEMAEKLAAPFKEDEYEWRIQQASKKGDKANVLCYVQARAIMNRLDQACGIFGWQADYVHGPDGGVLCRLSLRCPGTEEWVMKADGAGNTDIEPVKGGISGALKRAGNTWGIGRLLYSLPSCWVPLKPRGDHYFRYPQKHAMAGQVAYWDSPKLPDWAVAERCGGTPGADTTNETPEPGPEKPAVTFADAKKALLGRISKKIATASSSLTAKAFFEKVESGRNITCTLPEHLEAIELSLRSGDYDWATGDRIPEAPENPEQNA